MLRPAVETIEWLDSVNCTGWVERVEIQEELNAGSCFSVGFVVGEDDEFIYLSTTVNEEDCLAPISIPLGAVIYRELVLAAYTEEDEDDE